jgi:hypothetical protein
MDKVFTAKIMARQKNAVNFLALSGRSSGFALGELHCGFNWRKQ